MIFTSKNDKHVTISAEKQKFGPKWRKIFLFLMKIQGQKNAQKIFLWHSKLLFLDSLETLEHFWYLNHGSWGTIAFPTILGKLTSFFWQFSKKNSIWGTILTWFCHVFKPNWNSTNVTSLFVRVRKIIYVLPTSLNCLNIMLANGFWHEGRKTCQNV